MIKKPEHLKNWMPVNSVAAWVDENNLVHEVPFFSHVDFLSHREDFAQAYAIYSMTVYSNEERISDHLSSLDEGDHPAMHQFQGIDDDARDLLYLSAYNRGWVRLAMHGLVSNIRMEVYGNEETINKNRHFYTSLSKDLGNCSLSFWKASFSYYGQLNYSTEFLR